MAKRDYNLTKNRTKFDLEDVGERLLASAATTVSVGQSKTKAEVFSYVLREMKDDLFDAMITSMGKEDEHIHAPLMLLIIFLRGRLHGDPKGGFEATNEEMVDITNTVYPYLLFELVRRRQCFEVVKYPQSPWMSDAAIGVAGLNRKLLQEVVSELESQKIPPFPLFVDEETLDELEASADVLSVSMLPLEGAVIFAAAPAIQFQKLPGLDPELFAAAFYELGEKSLRSKSGGQDISPDSRTKGRPNPMMEAVLVFDEHFKEEDLARNAFVRFGALMHLLQQNQLENWIEKSDNGVGIQPVVITAAATMKLTKAGIFAPAQFNREIEWLVKQEQQPT